LFCDLPLHEVILLEAQAVDADAPHVAWDRVRSFRRLRNRQGPAACFGSLPIVVELHDAEESIRRFPAAAARQGWQRLVALENFHVISFGTAEQQ
jgi:hypothetical protein